MKLKKSRLDFRIEILPSFIFMHAIFFLVQLFFFYIYFVPTPFTEWNIPMIYYLIQQIGAPTVLICSLIWMNHTFFPGEAKYLIISLVLFIVEWFGVNRVIIQT